MDEVMETRVEFLRNVLNADEAVATAALNCTGSSEWRYNEDRYSGGEVMASDEDYDYVTCDSEGLNPSVQPDVGRYIAHFDPAHVLRRVGVDRRILDLHEQAESWIPTRDEREIGEINALRRIVNILYKSYVEQGR